MMRSPRIAGCALAALLVFAGSAVAPGEAAAKPKRSKKDKDKDGAKEKSKDKDKEKEKEKDEEKEKDVDAKPPIITHVRVTRSPIGRAITIRAKFDDESEIFAPSVYIRVQGSGAEFDSIAMKRGDDGWEATIAAEQTSASLEYFIEAFDEQGNGPAREGSPESPIRIVVYDPKKAPPPETPPIGPIGTGGEGGTPNGNNNGGGGVADTQPKELPKVTPKEETPDHLRIVRPEDVDKDDDDAGVAGAWWFWTAIGVAVTGGVVTTVLLLQRGGGRVEAVDIEVIGPDPTRNLP